MDGRGRQAAGSSRAADSLYEAYATAGLVSGKRGRHSNLQPAPGVADRALNVICDRYADFGPTLSATSCASATSWS